MFKKKLLLFLIFVLAISAVVATNIEVNDFQTTFTEKSNSFIYGVEYDLTGIGDDCQVVTYFYSGNKLIKNNTDDLKPTDGKCHVKTNCSLDSKKDIDHIEIHILKDGEILFNQTKDFDMHNDDDNKESSSVTYVASSKSGKFHTPGCEWAKKISGSNKVTFPNRNAAIDAGYSPCQVCSP